MSTRCQIAVYDEVTTEKFKLAPSVWLKEFTALIYRHSDGYPGTWDSNGRSACEPGILPDIMPFLKKFLVARGWDAEYLAARLLQFMCNHYGGGEGGVLGYGICNGFHGDIAYLYVICEDGLIVYDVKCDWDAEMEDRIEELSTHMFA